MASTHCKLNVCLQSQSERQHLEEEATSLEEAKQDLENRIVALDQIIESLNATIADLRHQLDKTNVEKVGLGVCH